MAPTDSGPIAQEKRLGHEMIDLGHDVYAEVSTYNGKLYGSIRKWFRSDDGKWYRTKNGLHMKLEDIFDVSANIEKAAIFFSAKIDPLTQVEVAADSDDIPF